MAAFYTYEFTKRGGDRAFYKMDFFRAGILPVSALEALDPSEKLPDGTIIDLTPEWKWEKYPYGIHAPIRAELLVLGTQAPATFIEWLTDPFATGTSATLYSGPATVSNPITFSLVVRVWYRRDVMEDWNLAWIGVADPVEDSAVEGNTIKLVFQDSLQAAMKMLSVQKMLEADFFYFTYNKATYVTERTAVYDYVWWTGTKFYFAFHDADPLKLWFVKWDDMITLWEQYVYKIWRLIIGKAGETDINFSTNLPIEALADRLRKQTYDSTPTPGALITSTGVYALPFITSSDGELLDSTLGRFYAASYKTFWDLYADLCEQSYRQCVVQYHHTGINFGVEVYAPRLESGGVAGVAAFDITSRAVQVKPKPRALILPSVTASTEFKRGDDVDSNEQRTQYGRNDGGETVTTVVRGNAHAYEGDEYHLEKKISIGMTYDAKGTFLGIRTRSEMNLFAFYYLDNPLNGSTYAFTANQFIRAHAWVELYIDGASVPSAPSSTDVSLPTTAKFSPVDLQAQILIDQTESGYIAQLPGELAGVFGSEMSATVEAVIPTTLVEHNGGDPDDNYELAWVPHLAKVVLDPSATIGWLTGTTWPAEWFVTGCKTSIKDAKSAIIAWGKS